MKEVDFEHAIGLFCTLKEYSSLCISCGGAGSSGLDELRGAREERSKTYFEYVVEHRNAQLKQIAKPEFPMCYTLLERMHSAISKVRTFLEPIQQKAEQLTDRLARRVSRFGSRYGWLIAVVMIVLVGSGRVVHPALAINAPGDSGMTAITTDPIVSALIGPVFYDQWFALRSRLVDDFDERVVELVDDLVCEVSPDRHLRQRAAGVDRLAAGARHRQHVFYRGSVDHRVFNHHRL